MTTQQIVLAERPNGKPTAATFRTQTVALPSLAAGQVHLQGLFYSVDPYMRGRMNDTKSYVSPFALNEPLEGGVVATVIESKAQTFAAGDVVLARLPWQQQLVVSGDGLQKVDTQLAPASHYLGLLGMTGLTAYFGLLDIGKPKSSENLVVSGAAGAVGTVVGQLGKLYGCRVIGIAGSDEKINLLKTDFGFDEALNYNTTTDMKEAIRQLCPKGVDIYFDNVGGPISDAVMANINFGARIPLCGQISMYNATEPPMGPRWQPMLLTRSALMQGFIVSNYAAHFAEGMQQLAQWYTAGKLKSTETILHGFDKLPQALIGLFEGANTGKMIVAAGA